MNSTAGERPRSFPEMIRRAAEECGIALSGDQVGLLEVHRSLLELWGKRMNLTAIRDPREIVRRHFLEGLQAGELLGRSQAAGTLLDLGSGNGIPGIPIRVVRPEASPLILVESSRKRAAFLRAVLRDLGWSDSRVLVRRIESGRDLEDSPCDIFTTRGVAPLDLLREGLPFLRPGGLALLFMRREVLETSVPIGRLPLRLVTEHLPEGREAGMILLRKL